MEPVMTMQILLLGVAIAVAIWSVGLAVFVVQTDIIARRSAFRLLTLSLFAILAARKANERRASVNDENLRVQL